MLRLSTLSNKFLNEETLKCFLLIINFYNDYFLLHCHCCGIVYVGRSMLRLDHRRAAVVTPCQLRPSVSRPQLGSRLDWQRALLPRSSRLQHLKPRSNCNVRPAGRPPGVIQATTLALMAPQWSGKCQLGYRRTLRRRIRPVISRSDCARSQDGQDRSSPTC